MGRKDTITKQYMKDTRIFADAFNQYLYDGKQVIQPESLAELDTTEIVIPYGNGGGGVPQQKYRDVLKLMKTDGNVAYCILGIENQSDIHYAMPVKNGVYDFMQLAHQVTETAKDHREQKKAEKQQYSSEEEQIEVGSIVQDTKNKPTSAEYLSGFYKTDRLIPVVTLVVFFGAEEWDGPLSLREMYAIMDDKIMDYVADYKVNLLAPYYMSEDEIQKFQSSLREVMLYIKYSKDKEQLKKVTHVFFKK